MKRGPYKRVCGECYLKYPRRFASTLIYHKDEGKYVCRKCWNEKFDGYYEKPDQHKKMHPIEMAIMPMFLFLCFIPAMIFGTIETVNYLHWNSLDATPVDELPGSGTVMIYGTINETGDTTAIGIHDVYSDGYYYWKYDPDGGYFNFSDETGTVNVSWINWYKIEKGTHMQMTKHGEMGYVYRGGDKIMIVGKVVERENGEKQIKLLYAAPEEGKIELSIYTCIFLCLCWSIIIGYYGWVVKRHIKFGRSHWYHVRHRYPNFSTSPLVTTDGRFQKRGEKTISDIIWHYNSKPVSLGWKYLLFVCTFCLWFYPFNIWLQRAHTGGDYWTIMTFAGIYLLFFFILNAFIWRRDYKPLSVGISDEGIHFIYSNPYIQLTKPGFVEWNTVKAIGKSISVESTNWEISRFKGENVKLFLVQKSNRSILISEWRKRRMKIRAKQRLL